MKNSDFLENAPGELVLTEQNAMAFVPNDLPPEIDLAKIALPLANATGKIGELKGACRRLTNPYIFIKPMQRLEAQTSSAMEGTHTTADKLALAEAGVKNKDDDQTTEVSNYISALEDAIKSIQHNPITHRTIKRAHELLLTNVGKMRGENKQPGQFKRNQNMIGAKTLENARFIPPPPNRTPGCIASLENFINADRPNELALIDIALVHYQFETIHPFADGNGRVGRMLITLMAISRGLLDVPALFISPALQKIKDEYIDRLYNVSTRGEWTEWLNFFFSSVSSTADQAVFKIDKIISLQDHYKRIAAEASTSVNLHKIIDMIFESPVIRPKDVVENVGITDAAARGLLNKLCELGILIEYKELYPRVWVALELIQLSTPDE